MGGAGRKGSIYVLERFDPGSTGKMSITLQMRVLELPIRVLRELDDITISSARKDRWEVCYNERVTKEEQRILSGFRYHPHVCTRLMSPKRVCAGSKSSFPLLSRSASTIAAGSLL